MNSVEYTLVEFEPAKLQLEIDSYFGASASAGFYSAESTYPVADQVVFTFPLGCSESDIQALEQIIDDHKPYVPLRIYQFVPLTYHHQDGSSDPPLDLNYETGLTNRLYRNVDMTFGEIQTITYCADCDFASAVVVERITYERDEIGFAQERMTEISWVDIHDNEHSQKKYLHKIYSPDESLREGQRRRKNIIDKLMMDVGGILIQTQQSTAQEALQLGRELFKKYAIDEKSYTEASDPSILGDFKNDQEHLWLDDEIQAGYSIRRYCFDSCNIWGLSWDDF